MTDHTPSFPAPAATGTARRKVLIFHIGDHKTGSTSIQLAFAKQQVALLNHSLLYPAKLAHNVLGDQCLAYRDAKSPQERQKAAQPLEKLADRIRQSDADFNLISAEALEKVPAALLHQVIKTFFADAADEIRIVAYARPHAGRISSTFGERMKIGAQRVIEGDLDSFYERSCEVGEFLYYPRFTAWREAFGDKFLLRPMIRSELYQGSVVNDFVRHTFGTEDFTVTTDGQANESLDLIDLMRLKVLQARILKNTTRNVRLHLGWEFSRLVGHMPPPKSRTKLQLHKSLAEKIRDTYLEDARAMDRTFFNGRKLMEDDLHKSVETALPQAQSTDPADHLPESELRSLEILSSLVAGMLKTKDVEWPAVFYKQRVKDMKKSRAVE